MKLEPAPQKECDRCGRKLPRYGWEKCCNLVMHQEPCFDEHAKAHLEGEGDVIYRGETRPL
jgi:hypothetical protein